MDEATLQAQVQELMRRPYAKVIRGEPVEGYLATVPELPGCVTAGETEAEALEMLQDAMFGWLAATIEDGDPVPPPLNDAGAVDLHLRLPHTFYQRLSDRARAEGRNLAEVAVELLSTALAVPQR